MRMINIGFNVQTDKAVKSLNDLEKRLKEINQYVKILESKHKVELDVSGVTSAVKQVKDTVAKVKDTEIISDKSIKSTTDKIEALNEEIVKMRVTLNKPNNLDDKTVGAFASKLAEVSRRAQELKEVMSDKDLMSGLDAKEIAILNVELKSITTETNKIKNTMNSLTDGSIEFIKALENMNRKSISLESTLAEIKRQSIITGKVDVKSNVEQTLKELESLKGKISKSYGSGSFVDMDEINKAFSLITSKSKQLEKDLTAPIKSILTQAKVGQVYGVGDKPKVSGVASLTKSLQVMSFEVNDIIANMNEKGFNEISNDASVLNNRVLDLVNSLKKVKSESEIPELIHQFNTLKNELKEIKKIQSESEMKTVKSILTSPKQGVLYGASQRPKISGVDSSIENLEVLRIQLEKLSKIDPSKRAEEGLRDVSKESIKLISDVNRLKEAFSKVDDKSDIPNLKAQLIDVRNEFNKLNKAKLDTPKVGGTDLGNLVGYYTIFNTIKSQMSNFMALEDATYDLGVVAQFTDDQIQIMRKTIIDTATTLPNSAVEITKAMDAVMRTGKSYEEATNIVENTAKLAVASGEDLANAVGIVNKLFLALDINARNTDVLDKALQQLHATAVFTATDLEGLGESAKQWAGAVGGLVRTTTKTGTDLETYKSQLLDMGTAFSGILSNMGRLKDVCSTSDPYVEKSA